MEKSNQTQSIKSCAMKISIFLTVFASAISLTVGRTDEEKQHFRSWSKQFAKKYPSEHHEVIAMEKMLKSKEIVEAHNKLYEQGKSTYKMCLSEHSDLSIEEMQQHLLGYRESSDELSSRSKRESRGAHAARYDFPAGPPAIDWRDKGLVGPVVNQHKCGSCWAVSTVEIIYAYMKKQGKDGRASVQQLVDCCHNEASGCNGGNPYHALQYIKENGITSASEYPYTNSENSCNYKSNQQIATIKEAQRVFTVGNETLLR